MDQTVKSTESRTQTARELTDTLAHDGFVVFHKFLPLADVEQARAEIAALYERDLEERRTRGVNDYHYDGAAGHSILTKPTHLLLDLYGKSPALDRIFERILTDPVSSAVLKELCGGDIKLRGYNCTRLTGEYDPAPTLGPAPNPHEWHRDSFGEIGFGIFLDDFPGPNHGTTALMRGSHVYPYDPRWHTLFGPPHPPYPAAYKYNPFSRLLAKRLRPTMTGAYGRRGDFYIFINDTWHGREPNLEKHAGLRVMIGAFAADVPYPDRVADLTPAVLAKLPPNVRRVAPQPRAASPLPAKRILDDVLAEQKRRASGPLFTLTRLERQLVEWWEKRQKKAA